MSSAPREALLQERSVRGRVYRLLPGGTAVLGRDKKTCHILFKDDLHVSRRHCALQAAANGEVVVRDQSSRGTFLNDERVESEVLLRPGDRLRLGPETELEHVGVLDPARPRRDPEGALQTPLLLTPRYIALRTVGRGAAGYVYEAHDEEGQRRCALKLVSAVGPASQEMVERFRREAQLQAKLRDYPGIVTVRDFGTLPQTRELYLAMDFVQGETYHKLLREGLPLLEGLRMLTRIARAVGYAHEQGVIHRDLKPSNVLVSEEGQIRLTDFGVCKAIGEDDAITGTGVMLGTPNYMAPEQIDDSRTVTELADGYALGAVLYVVLTRRLPFFGETVGEILDRVHSGQVIPPSQLEVGIDPALEQLCLRTLSLDQARRPPSAVAFARELEAIVKQQAPAPKVSLTPPPKGKR